MKNKLREAKKLKKNGKIMKGKFKFHEKVEPTETNAMINAGLSNPRLWPSSSSKSTSTVDGK